MDSAGICSLLGIFSYLISICTKHLPSLTRYPQQHLEVPKVSVAVLAMDTVGDLPITTTGERWVLTVIYLHTSYVFTVSMKEKSAENIVQAYLPNILTQKVEMWPC